MIPSPVSAARRMSCAAFLALAGAVPSKVYTKRLVSRKNLPLIHLVPGVGASRAYMPQPPHQCIHGSSASRLRCVLLQPLTEGRIQGCMPRLGYQSRLFDQGFLRAESNVLHTEIVYTILV